MLAPCSAALGDFGLMCASSQFSPRVITCASAAFVTESICFICSTAARSLAMARTSSCRSRSARAAFSCTIRSWCLSHHGHASNTLVSVRMWRSADAQRYADGPSAGPDLSCPMRGGNQHLTCISCSCSLIVSVLSFSSSCAMHATHDSRSHAHLDFSRARGLAKCRHLMQFHMAYDPSRWE